MRDCSRMRALDRALSRLTRCRERASEVDTMSRSKKGAEGSCSVVDSVEAAILCAAKKAKVTFGRGVGCFDRST